MDQEIVGRPGSRRPSGGLAAVAPTGRTRVGPGCTPDQHQDQRVQPGPAPLGRCASNVINAAAVHRGAEDKGPHSRMGTTKEGAVSRVQRNSRSLLGGPRLGRGPAEPRQRGLVPLATAASLRLPHPVKPGCRPCAGLGAAGPPQEAAEAGGYSSPHQAWQVTPQMGNWGQAPSVSAPL